VDSGINQNENFEHAQDKGRVAGKREVFPHIRSNGQSIDVTVELFGDGNCRLECNLVRCFAGKMD
jgi:hypothetical protein